MDIKTRLKEVEDLSVYLTEKDELFSNILNDLGWKEEILLDEVNVQCPYDTGHWVPETALSKHLEMCSWVKDGYPKEEKAKQPPSSKFFYQKSSIVSLVIDKETQANILLEKGLIEKKPLDEMPDVPQTVDRWSQELTTEQRLAIYDYVVKESKSGRHNNLTMEDLMFDFENKDNQDSKPKTQLEILAEQRDYKRRRQSYRAKNVHITKKSYTEVMKEVIENQISFLAETKKQENNERIEEATNEELEPKSPEQIYAYGEDERNHDSKHSHKRSRRDQSPLKRRKHKHKRSRSRSGSRKRHKKSSHKHKKSHD